MFRMLEAGDPAAIGGVTLVARALDRPGVVYLGRSRLGTWVEVTVLDSASVTDAARREAASRVRLVARVDSPFVADVEEASISSDPAYVVSPHVVGSPLADVVSRLGPLTASEISALLLGTAQGIRELAALDLDVSVLGPRNVVLSESGPVLVSVVDAEVGESTHVLTGAAQSRSTDAVASWGRLSQWALDHATDPDAVPPELRGLVERAANPGASPRPSLDEVVVALCAGRPATDEVRKHWSRLSGFAQGSQDSLDQLLSKATILAPTEVASVAPTVFDRRPVMKVPEPSGQAMQPIVVQVPDRRVGTWVTVAVLAVTMVVAIGVGLVIYLGQSGALAPAASPPTAQPTVTVAPAPTVTVTQAPAPRPTVTATRTRTVSPLQPPDPDPLPFLTDSMIEGTYDRVCRTSVPSMPDLVTANSDAGWTTTIQVVAVIMGYNPGPIDGQYGPRTIAAVKKVQSELGTVPDGQVGPITWTAVQNYLCGGTP